jgi:DNA-binding ferritin-like protein
MFGNLAKGLWKSSEHIAGRIRALGVHASGTIQPPHNARIPAYPVEITSVEDHLREVSMRLAILIGLLRLTRDLAGDRDEDQTEDLLTEIMLKLETKGRRLINSMPDAVAAQAMITAQTALGGAQNAAGTPAKKTGKK